MQSTTRYVLWCHNVHPRHYAIILVVVSMCVIILLTLGGKRLPRTLPDWMENQSLIIRTQEKGIDNLEAVFKFVPKDLIWCEQLLAEKERETFPEAYLNLVSEFSAEVEKVKGKGMDGHIGQNWRQSMAYGRLANNSVVKTICETGFNVGHSALVWLTFNPTAHIYFFDLGQYNHNKAMANFFLERFPGRLTFTWGDSRKTVSEFVKKNHNLTCDLLHVDGGHAYNVAKADLRNLRPLVVADKHLLLLDDYPAISQEAVGVAWKEQLHLGQVQEYWKCQFAFQREKGFTVGKFTNL